MKRIPSLFAAVLLLALLVPAPSAWAAGPLDEIKSYTITVDPRSDGTLDLIYRIDWLVLDSTSEGPLSWVKIGIPNSHADAITALSPTISKIGYMSDNGSYVRIDLDKSYKAGETVSFAFSIHQSYMYRLDSASNTCSFTFVPGWFDETRVDSLKILWNSQNVSYSDATGTEGSYLTWGKPMEPGERLTIIVRYPSDAFTASADMQADQDYQSDQSYQNYQNYQGYQNNQYTQGQTIVVNGSTGSPVSVVFVVIVVIFIIIAAAGGGNNRYRGGFGGRGRGGFHGGGGGHCACASSCACACACACAGGGRAGCSAKNFYGAAQTEALRVKLISK